MYNSFNNMWNWDYIQQQQALQHHQNQVYQIADCAKKLKDLQCNGFEIWKLKWKFNFCVKKLEL